MNASFTGREPGVSLSPRILLCLTGLAPQVVTETLHALHHRMDPPFRPDRLILLSTAAGLELAQRLLLAGDEGAWHRFRRDWPEAAAPLPEMVVLEGLSAPLADIRTSAEAALAADQIGCLIRDLTAEEGGALHISIAGGRKTMSAIVAGAMTLYARPQDTISHVLVAPPFENRPDFFFPRPGDHAAERALSLADIPFVRMRDHLPATLLSEPLGYERLIRSVQTRLEVETLSIDLADGVIRAGGPALDLPPIEAAFYAWLALRRKREEPPLTTRTADPAAFLDLYSHFAARRRTPFHLERVRQSLQHGIEATYLAERKARLNRALRRQLGPRALPFLVVAIGRRPQTAIGLALPPSLIRIREA